MLWYGFIYYFLLLFFVYIFSIYLIRSFYINSLNFTLISNIIISLSLGFFLGFFFLSMTIVYYLLDFYSSLSSFSSILNFSTLFFDYNSFNYLINTKYTGFYLLNIYIFPFVFIFLFVTLLSILFCLAYNTHEIISFVFYCTLILLAGYIVFSTTSLIIFFLSYELLLIPSFFILYNFAKTRRCVEAAYLMFFWTQFGALFLILGFLYLFFSTNSTSFHAFNDYFFTSFELNFIFICLIFGFGVKLPIWPFYGWLPKAHVEASTNFSIFLSGVLVKFAFY